MINKKCEFCGNEFSCERKSQKYCCEKCRKKAKAKRIAKGLIEKECKICGKKIMVEGKARETEYCSVECKREGKKTSNICLICGNTFIAERRTKTCSKECTKKYLSNKRITKVCLICGKEFIVPKSRGGKAKFCSKDCYRESRRTGKTPNCTCSNKECSNTFYKAPSLQKRHRWNFCSKECMGKVYIESGEFSGENSPSFNGLYGDRKKKYYGDNWLKRRREIRKRDSYCCQLCGISEAEYGMELSVHHKIPFVVFKDYKDANELSNLQSLCEPCHRIVHSGGNHPTKFKEKYEKLMIQSAL